MATTYFWRFGDHEVTAVPRFLRGFDVRHDGKSVAQLRMPLYAAEFAVEENGRRVVYRLRVVKAPFPYRSFVAAEIDRDGVPVVGTR